MKSTGFPGFAELLLDTRRVPLLACPAVPSEKESGRFIMPVVEKL